ncbi:MAG TPA: autotransporter outer membrane beta-barrel domain-containing protein [Xanthobacteraceae bacterium]
MTRPGLYTFSFWENTAFSSTFSLTASAGGTTTFNAIVSNTSYVQQSATVNLSAGTNAIQFSGSALPPYTYSELMIDDVSLFLLSASALSPLLPPGAPTNAVNVAAAIDSTSGALPTGFLNANLYNLSGSSLVNALEQVDGENNTGAERGAFDLMNEFLGLMLDPFVDGRGGFASSAQPLGFAPDQQASLPPDVALAYAGVLKAPPPQSFAQRWTAWGSAFGGSASTNGSPAVGSNNVTTSTYGYAAGMDYHYSPDTVFGFSLAGGGANWGLANALGAGRSDAALAGLYGVTHQGPAYIGAALAFANNWFTTNRTALGDQVTARFQGQSYSARLEGGYRFAVPVYHGVIGLTPYAALQVQAFHTPSYSETDITGGGLGLSYAAMNGTDTRSELGARFDDPTLLGNMPLVLRAKLAWAHDWVSDPSLNASFESLPGASFTVNGAPIPHDSALTSAGAQLFLTSNWSFLAKFDGEFASGSQLYAGTGTLRYTW